MMKWPGQFAVVYGMFSWMLCGNRKHWEDIASKLGGSHSGFFELSALEVLSWPEFPIFPWLLYVSGQLFPMLEGDPDRLSLVSFHVWVATCIAMLCFDVYLCVMCCCGGALG